MTTKKNVFKSGNKIFRKKAADVPGAPVELDFPDDWDDKENVDEPDPDDAYLQTSGNLGSRFDLTIEGNYIDTFRSQEDAEAFLAEWAQENNFFPNLWFIDERGGLDGPIEYGGADPDRHCNEGATYRRADKHRRTAEVIEGWDVDALIHKINEYVPPGSSRADLKDYIDREEDYIDIEIYTIASGALGIYQPDVLADRFDITLTQEDKDYDFGWEIIEERADKLSDKLSNALTTWGIPGYIYFGHNEADGSYGLRYSVDVEDVVDSVEGDPVSALHDATTVTSEMGSKRTALINNWNDEEGELSDIDDEDDGDNEEFGLPISEDEKDLFLLENDEDDGDDENFSFDVSLLDEVVINELKEERPPDYNDGDDDGNFTLFVEEKLVDEVGNDLDKVERTINDASVVTTVSGRYSLETEGDVINVFFEAEMDEINKLREEFVSLSEGL